MLPTGTTCQWDGEEDTICACDDCTTRAISRAWEVTNGSDSVATIESIYYQRPSGAYECIWPGCRVARRDAVALWRHVHTAHGTGGLPPSDFDWMAVDVG